MLPYDTLIPNSFQVTTHRFDFLPSNLHHNSVQQLTLPFQISVPKARVQALTQDSNVEGCIDFPALVGAGVFNYDGMIPRRDEAFDSSRLGTD
jgi:hypothetical protein